MVDRLEEFLTGGGIVVTLIASVMGVLSLGSVGYQALMDHETTLLLQILLFVPLTGFLIYGNVVYQAARLGYLRRRHTHRAKVSRPSDSAEISSCPSLVILVPSYKEEVQVVRQTLLSAALQQYSQKRVVLLLDDPPHPAESKDQLQLMGMRQMVAVLSDSFEHIRRVLEQAHADFDACREAGNLDRRQELRRLGQCYEQVSDWFEMQAVGAPRDSHTDRWFIDHILQEPGACYQTKAKEVLKQAAAPLLLPVWEDINSFGHAYRQLTDAFDLDLTIFERKQYRNLCHEPNKAMNLNAYLGVMGKCFREVLRADGRYLEEAPNGEGMTFPDSTYVLTLDADSLLLPDYAVHLITFLEQPAHARVGVAQTPYSAIPHAPGLLERTAGATTDIQYFIHQGFSAYGATFWVGANAVLRKAALEDLCVQEIRDGIHVRRYIQDRTVIEDTESTVDLLHAGWRLYNYPERLAYSATPSDFGALAIQRGRWANGGLLIFPKLVRYWRHATRDWSSLLQAFHQLHYLISLAIAPFCVLLLLAIPFSDQLFTVWWILAAAPYFFLYARDLHQAGYQRPGDLLRVYALNLLLIPVHLRGAYNSLKQACTGIKCPFLRTPKIAGRTNVAGQIIVLECLLFLQCVALFSFHAVLGHSTSALFAFVNATLLLYALSTFMDIPACLRDLKWGDRVPLRSIASADTNPTRLGRLWLRAIGCIMTASCLGLPDSTQNSDRITAATEVTTQREWSTDLNGQVPTEADSSNEGKTSVS